LRLIVYPGAYHSFNAASLRDKPRSGYFEHLHQPMQANSTPLVSDPTAD
jgi:hypothetical protein